MGEWDNYSPNAHLRLAIGLIVATHLKMLFVVNDITQGPTNTSTALLCISLNHKKKGVTKISYFPTTAWLEALKWDPQLIGHGRY